MMLIVVVMGSMFAVTSQLEFVSRKYSRDEATLKSLALAREALIAYAMTYRDNNSNEVFGYLPCPDSSGDGAEDTNDGTQCRNTSSTSAAIGLFPYKTLGLPDLRDSEGGCLWYAVSGKFKAQSNNKYTPLNWDTQGQFSIVGTTVAPEQGDGGAVAVIFAAGPPLSGQSRSVSGSFPCQTDPSQVTAFLDGNYNFASSSTIAITPGSSGSTSNNDQIAWITPRDIFDKVVLRSDFSNLLTSSPAGQINQLSDEIKAKLETKIQNDLVNSSSTSVPRNVGSYTQFAGKQVGDLQTGLLTVPADTWGYYYLNWTEQYRQVTCSPLTACLTIAGTACRGALMFGGRSSTTNGYAASGLPRLTAHKTSSTANLNYYFESGSGRDILNSAATAFTGLASYAAASPSADVGICLVPGVIDSFAQDIPSYTTIVSNVAIPQATINVVAQTVTIGTINASSTTGSGCVWFPTQLPFSTLLRAYFKINIADIGEGFVYALVDGPNNQAAMGAGTLCGATTNSLLGYGSPVAAPKFGLEIDTRLNSTANCTGSNRNDPSANHMAIVYWGAAATTTDDNCHGSTAGTLGSGSQPLNPRTLSTSATTPATTVASVSSATWSSNVAVITTAAAHGQSSDQQVTIAGITPTGYNGNYAVKVIDATHLAYSLATNPGTYASAGTVATSAGIKNVQASDTMLPYAGTLPLATDIHVRVDASKTYGPTSIQAASWSAGTATITTPAAHGLQAGQQITTSGYAPGTYAIGVPDPTHLTIPVVADPGAYSSGGSFKPPLGLTVASASAAAAGSAWNVTLQTSAAHGFVSGQPVTIAGITPAAYNGTSQIVQVAGNPSQFTYALGTNPGAYTSGGTLTAAVALTIKAYVASTFPSCTLTDFQNLSSSLNALCAVNPSVEQDNVYMNVDSLTGKVMDTIYSGFTNAQSTSGASRQSITVSNFIIRTQ